MPSSRDARDWAAAGGLRGIGDSLYTPFSGPDGDSIDFDAYRTLVRYCVGDLGLADHQVATVGANLLELGHHHTPLAVLLLGVIVGDGGVKAGPDVDGSGTGELLAGLGAGAGGATEGVPRLELGCGGAAWLGAGGAGAAGSGATGCGMITT